MKKNLLTILLVGLLSLGTMAFAGPCPIDKPCNEKTPIKCEKWCDEPPETCCFDKCKLAEKLKLTCEQKEKAEKIKNSAMKKQQRIHKKMKNLKRKSFTVKKEAMQDFEAILTPQQRCEFKKLREAKKLERRSKCPCDCECKKYNKPCPCDCDCKRPCDKKPCAPCEKPDDKAPCKKPCDKKPCTPCEKLSK